MVEGVEVDVEADAAVAVGIRQLPFNLALDSIGFLNSPNITIPQV